MSQPLIDKNIPMPGLYPFAQMQVGDSFLLLPTMRRATVSVAAQRYGAKHGAKFTVRKVPDGLRCWRVA